MTTIEDYVLRVSTFYPISRHLCTIYFCVKRDKICEITFFFLKKNYLFKTMCIREGEKIAWKIFFFFFIKFNEEIRGKEKVALHYIYLFFTFLDPCKL